MPPLAGGMLRVSIRASAGGPLPKRSAGIAPLIASAARGARFQGYLVAVCDFRKAYGFALILDGFGEIDFTLALGYLAVRDPWNK